ncbi:unnamed protein product, partial [Nesidiocoris tenuis]
MLPQIFQCSRSCGGGIAQRMIWCIRDNKTVSTDECDDEEFISGNTYECNTVPCGEDELMPVSTAQVITEEESEECDYDYGDYGSGDAAIDEDDTSTTVSLGAVGVSDVSTTSDSEDEGSGGMTDDAFISSSLGPEEKSTVVVETTSEAAELSSAAGVSDGASSMGVSDKSSDLPESSETMADEPT